MPLRAAVSVLQLGLWGRLGQTNPSCSHPVCPAGGSSPLSPAPRMPRGGGCWRRGEPSSVSASCRQRPLLPAWGGSRAPSPGLCTLFNCCLIKQQLPPAGCVPRASGCQEPFPGESKEPTTVTVGLSPRCRPSDGDVGNGPAGAGGGCGVPTAPAMAAEVQKALSLRQEKVGAVTVLCPRYVGKPQAGLSPPKCVGCCRSWRRREPTRSCCGGRASKGGPRGEGGPAGGGAQQGGR